MHLACLMAGVSNRLMPLTATRHKATLPLNGRRMLDYQLDTFRAAGITSTTFVLGHGAAEVAALLHAGYGDTRFNVRNNPHYKSRNLDWSAYLALSAEDGAAMYYEGDLIVPPTLMRQLKDSAAEICVAVDANSRSEVVDTLVLAPGGKVRELLFVEHGSAQGRAGDGSVGEFICMVKLGPRARQFVVEQLALQSFEGPMTLYRIFERAFARFDTAFVDAAGRPWVEVDNARDLARAATLADAALAA